MELYKQRAICALRASIEACAVEDAMQAVRLGDHEAALPLVEALAKLGNHHQAMVHAEDL
eukprot:576259-Amphidinium_carterae.1